MPRSPLRTFHSVTGGSGGDADEVSRLSSPYDDLNQQIIRLLQEDFAAACSLSAACLSIKGRR